MSFGQDGEKKFMQDWKLGRSEIRRKETFKLENLFWYETILPKMHGQWKEYWKISSDEEGFVHSVQLVIGKNSSNSKEISVFEQPVNKLVLLVKNEP